MISGLLAAGFASTPAYGLVKITSPAKGQQVPVGNIVVSGTSSLTLLTIAMFQSLLMVLSHTSEQHQQEIRGQMTIQIGPLALLQSIARLKKE